MSKRYYNERALADAGLLVLRVGTHLNNKQAVQRLEGRATTMSETEYSSLAHQFKGCVEILDHLVENNIVLKQRLAEIIAAQQHTKPELEEIEAFQNSLLNKDAHLLLLREDIKAQEKLAAALGNEEATFHDFSHRQGKLQYEVSMVSEQISHLTKAFDAEFITCPD